MEKVIKESDDNSIFRNQCVIKNLKEEQDIKNHQ